MTRLPGLHTYRSRWAVPAVRALIAALVLGPGSAAAQTQLSPTGGLGLILLDEKPGASFALGGRLSTGALAVTGVFDLALVGWGVEDERYEWHLFTCQDRWTHRDVAASRCPDPEVLPAASLDLAFVLGPEADVKPLIGAGYRVGGVDTFFGLVGLTGWLGGPYRWHGRLLLNGTSFFQLQFGVSLF